MGNRGKLVAYDPRVFLTTDRSSVSGEPSFGTIRRHNAELVDTDPNTSVTAVDCSGEVEFGSRTILLHIDVDSTGAALVINFYDHADGAVENLWAHYETDSGNSDDHDQVIVGLDENRKFYYQATNVNINSLDIDMAAYWL